MPIATINPATGETLRTFDPLTAAELEGALSLAASTFESYRETTFAQRAAWMNAAAELLLARADEYGRLLTLEMGKPLAAAVSEVQKCASACRYYAEHAAAFLADEPVATDAARSFIRYQPLGAILAVMPWNFPFWQVFRFAAPALMAGNVGLLKHASNVPQSALAIESVLRDAGFPAGTFQTLLVGSVAVAAIVEDDRVKAVTLTGSEGAGASVASIGARQIKKSVLELGGSDPFIVMPSADLDAAIRTAIQARLVNNGQSCIAAKRFIVHEAIADEFERRFVTAFEALRLGDPMDASTDLGPLAMPQLVKDLDEQVRQSVAAGARLLTGGKRIAGPGNFYQPTVLTDIPPDSPAYRDELFGPVASLFRVADAVEAIRIANDTPFGLGASVWTGDDDEMTLFIDRIDSGQVFVNAMVASDPRVPFGGVKRSGFGRELGVFGIREFVNVKTVWIA